MTKEEILNQYASEIRISKDDQDEWIVDDVISRQTIYSAMDDYANQQTSSLQLRVKELEEALKEAHETFGGIEDIANKEGYLSTNKIWSWANYAARQISNVLNKALNQ